jgi:hypothetical protein
MKPSRLHVSFLLTLTFGLAAHGQPAAATDAMGRQQDAFPLTLAGCIPVDQPKIPEIAAAVADRKSVALVPSYAIYSTYLWPLGSKLKVSFMDGDARSQQLLAQVATQWEKCANIIFDFVDEKTQRLRQWKEGDGSVIRISFSGRFGLAGNVSYIGRPTKEIPSNQATMNIAEPPGTLYTTRFERVVLHEFGHVLGFRHEHMHPLDHCNDEINLPAAYDYYARTQSPPWYPQEVRMNLLYDDTTVGYVLSEGVEKKDPIVSVNRDNASIMMYELPPEILKAGVKSKCYVIEARTLSEGDRKGAGIAYPFPGDDAILSDQIKTIGGLIQKIEESGLAANPAMKQALRHNQLQLQTGALGLAKKN